MKNISDKNCTICVTWLKAILKKEQRIKKLSQLCFIKGFIIIIIIIIII
jgi:hypothetical protein